MPLNLDLNDHMPCIKSGFLYIVATPIGHMEDITIRALKVLNQVNLIAAEDTRETQKLLRYYQIQTPLMSCHDHNETFCAEKIMSHLQKGYAIALVSDAGTPMISDPGYRVVSMAIESKLPVVPIPGPSAAMAALSVSGLPTDSFIFQGFLPKKSGKREKILNQLAFESRTLIFFESPKRIGILIDHLIHILGDRKAMLGRELTKHYEECVSGHLTDIQKWRLQKNQVKGECTLLVAGYENNKQAVNIDLRSQISHYIKKHTDQPLSQSVKEMVVLFGKSRKTIYDIALHYHLNQ